MMEKMSTESSHSTSAQIIPILMKPPLWLEPFIERLEAFGYAAMKFGTKEYDALNLVHPPAVAVVPYSARTSLASMQSAIEDYQRRYPDALTSFLAVYSGRQPYKINDIYRMGMSGCFQSPLEDEIFLNKICELAPVNESHKNLTLDKLVRIGIGEIEDVKSLPFDVFVYLPVNRKTILYLEKDSVVDEKIIKKFRENSHYNLVIRRSEIRPYQTHVRSTLKSVSAATPMDRAQKQASTISNLLGGFFEEEEYNEDEGGQMVENLKAFVSDLEDASGTPKEIVDSVSNFASQMMTTLTHSQNVGAYCAYFGLALGFTEPQTLRMGGLLHDVGSMDLPRDLQVKDSGDMTPEELAKFKTHVVNGIQALSKKKVSVPKEVIDMIMYHHEHTDGSGFPMKKKGSEIPPFAKICAFANEFDKLTSVRMGYPQYAPVEAVKKIAGLDGSTASPIYDPDFHKPLVDLFLNSSKKLKEAKALEVKDVKPAPSAAPTKPKMVSLSRLLKTEQFAMPAYAPSLAGGDDFDKSVAMKELSQQLADHWKR